MPYLNLVSGERVEVVMTKEGGGRLAGTCFRGTDCRQAGNFFQWPYFSAFIEDEDVQDKLKLKLAALVANASVNHHHRFELEFSHDIGWDSVMEVKDLTDEDLASCETRKLNRRASALFLPDGKILAPKTNVLTMVVGQRHKQHWQFIIRTIYPGYDIGTMAGDMTQRFSFVWMPWSNPGE